MLAYLYASVSASEKPKPHWKGLVIPTLVTPVLLEASLGEKSAGEDTDEVAKELEPLRQGAGKFTCRLLTDKPVRIRPQFAAMLFPYSRRRMHPWDG